MSSGKGCVLYGSSTVEKSTAVARRRGAALEYGLGER